MGFEMIIGGSGGSSKDEAAIALRRFLKGIIGVQGVKSSGEYAGTSRMVQIDQRLLDEPHFTAMLSEQMKEVKKTGTLTSEKREQFKQKLSEKLRWKLELSDHRCYSDVACSSQRDADNMLIPQVADKILDKMVEVYRKQECGIPSR